MKVQNKTILITGGGSGIGFAIAQAFQGKGNRLILAGRNESRLKAAASQLLKTTYVVCDITNEKDIQQLVQKIKNEFGGIDILVNNAGVVLPQSLVDSTDIYEKAKYEIDINFLSVIRLTEKLLPSLVERNEAAIINIQSIVSYLPALNIATYSASKAALHSYSQALRLALETTTPHVKVFEVFPPYVDTEMAKGIEAEKLQPEEVAQDILYAVEHEEYAIRNGKTKNLYESFLQSPEDALRALNSVEV
jgi:uncharacterized oxidoreductase